MSMIGQLLTGRYLILEKLGAGGFSETYLARDKYLPRHPLCVVKCLKLPPHSTISLEIAHRLFETEAHLLEQFGQHHNQIPTLFAYVQEQDSTYLVQEYIEGEDLSTGLRQGKRFTLKAAIALLLEMLPVLDYIHSQRVIHRDISPSNLIRRRRDGKMVLIDFGAAYCLSENESRMQPDNDLSLEIGTPGYMPDEQRLGMAQTNSDLYGLGILVIHLLTGVDPQQFKQDLISGELDWQRYLQPSSVPLELTTILDRMVRSRVSDRYQQASEVLNDLQALPASQRFRPRGASRRHSWAQQMVLPAGTMLLIGTVALQASQGAMGGWFSDYKQAKSALTQLGQKFLPRSDGQLTMLRELSIKSGVERVLIVPNNRVMVTAGADQVLRLWSLPNGKRIKTLVGSKALVTTLAISQDSKFLVSGREDGTLQLWDAALGKLLKTFKGHQKSVTAIAISPDSQTLVSSSKDRTLRQWRLNTGELLQTLSLPQADITAITYGATSNTLITANRQLQVWDLRTGQVHRTFSGHTDTIVGLQLVNDHTLISFGKDRGLMWDLNREALVQVLPEASANPTSISRCDRNIITVHSNGSIRTWIPESGNLVMRESGTLERPANVAFSPNHDYLVTWNANQQVRFWQINDESIH